LLSRVCLALLAGMVLLAASPVEAQAVSERWINAAYIKNGAIETGNASARLAVRAGPGLNFTQLDALASGTQVTVLETRNGWARISPPAAASVQAPAAAPAAASGERWINAAYVKNGAIDTGGSSAKLAVRAGPGLNHAQVDSLASGTKVSPLETRSGWMRIAAPTAQTVAAPAARPAVQPVQQPPRPAQQAPRPAPVASRPAPVQAPAPAAQPPVVSRPPPEPVRPPIDNLILSGDFSETSLALPTVSGNSTSELSGRWLRPSSSAWDIMPQGGNLGPYARVSARGEPARLLYVVHDGKRSTGSYLLRFDYLLTDPADELGVKVFVTEADTKVGSDGGDFRMNSTQRPADMVLLKPARSWTTFSLPVELGSGYNCIYVLFTGTGAGSTGIDNVSLSPRSR